VPELQARGLELSSLDVARQGKGDRYESEVRLYAYRDAHLCDALEDHLWRAVRMNDPATAYYSPRGGYVVRNNRTGDIVQVSDRTDPGWRAPWGP
jgi:hypothetical protein